MIANMDNDKPLARLLVVDDDSDNAEVLKLGLLNYGFLVDAFTNPEDALHSFKSNPESYRLVLSDGWMPSISGMQLAEKAKKANPNVKVLLLSGSEMIENEFSKVSPSASVVDGFVQKPIGIRELTNKILSLIGEAKGQTSFEG
jgi:two-component system cell cycle sensor histidine kinase/response regulator CckA